MTEITIPMPHELRTQLNEELRAWAELRDKLKDLNENMDMLLLRLKETVLSVTSYVNNMEIKIDPQDAEDVAVDIAVEQSQLEKPVCKKCGSTLVDDGYGEASACTNCA